MYTRVYLAVDEALIFTHFNHLHRITCARVRVCTFTCMHICMCVHIYVCARMHAYTHVHVYVCVCMYMYVYACVYARHACIQPLFLVCPARSVPCTTIFNFFLRRRVLCKQPPKTCEFVYVCVSHTQTRTHFTHICIYSFALHPSAAFAHR